MNCIFIISQLSRFFNPVYLSIPFFSVNPFFVYCGAIIDIVTDTSVPMEMIKPMRFRSIPHRLGFLYAMFSVYLLPRKVWHICRMALSNPHNILKLRRVKAVLILQGLYLVELYYRLLPILI